MSHDHKQEGRNPRTSPPRRQLSAGTATNPEKSPSQRTIELATDQSIAARHLLYFPSEASLEVIRRCVNGIGCVMDRFLPTDDDAQNLLKNEILVSMMTRLMADGSMGRVDKFNDFIKELVEMKNINPQPEIYANKVASLAKKCREKMKQIQRDAIRPGPIGAVARQAVLAFMGDLGGLEKQETGYGKAFADPLCKPEEIYNVFLEGLYDAYRELNKITTPGTPNDFAQFKLDFEQARQNTSLKGNANMPAGGLSAPKHTSDKKGQRKMVDSTLLYRRGLLNTGPVAEIKISEKYPGHKQILYDAAWPEYKISLSVVQHVVEPLTGHISGSLGEVMAVMNMFCGTPLQSMTVENPSGTPDQKLAFQGLIEWISALAAAGLITAGYHSAVEVYPAMCTFSTHPTYLAIGPEAFENVKNQAAALKEYITQLATTYRDKRPEKLTLHGYEFEEDELTASAEQLQIKADCLEEAANKFVDMIAILQGNEGTMATLEVNRVMANASSHPEVLFDLYSTRTQLEELGIQGYTLELEDARQLFSKDPHHPELPAALAKAKIASERLEVFHKAIKKAEEYYQLKRESYDAARITYEQNLHDLSSHKRRSDQQIQKVYQDYFFKRLIPPEIETETAKKLLGDYKSTLPLERSASIQLEKARVELNVAEAELEKLKLELRNVDTIFKEAAQLKLELVLAERTLIEKEVIYRQECENHQKDRNGTHSKRKLSDGKMKDKMSEVESKIEQSELEWQHAAQCFTDLKIKSHALSMEVIARQKGNYAILAQKMAEYKESNYESIKNELKAVKDEMNILLQQGWGPHREYFVFEQVSAALDSNTQKSIELIKLCKKAELEATSARAEAVLAEDEAIVAREAADMAKREIELLEDHHTQRPSRPY